MSLSTLLSVAGIVASSAVAVLGFLLREHSRLSYAILALGIIAAIASAWALVLHKREMARIRNITNAGAHSMFGGI